ncbi:hypothetical protein V2J09_017832 [Rumex salicifolius]
MQHLYFHQHTGDANDTTCETTNPVKAASKRKLEKLLCVPNRRFTNQSWCPGLNRTSPTDTYIFVLYPGDATEYGKRLRFTERRDSKSPVNGFRYLLHILTLNRSVTKFWRVELPSEDCHNN